MAAEDLTTFVLIRHALHELGSDTIVGRTPGVRLSPAGVTQAEHLADRLSLVPLDALYCSPIQRTLETLQPLAERRGLAVQICPALQEIDYGDWTGRRLDELRGSPQWERWNAFRSGHRPPNGESMVEIQTRVVSLMLELREQHPAGRIALVSHGDVIKAAVAYCLGAPLDLFHRIEISPASVTVVIIGEHGPWVLCVNNVASVEELPSF